VIAVLPGGERSLQAATLQRRQTRASKKQKPHGAVALEIKAEEPHAGTLARAIMIGWHDLTERLGQSRELHQHEPEQLALAKLCGIESLKAREKL
jgi:hypothetical protein